MLSAARADTWPVLHRLLTVIAIVACGFVFVSFAMFARDQLSASSTHQQAEIVSGRTPASTPVVTGKHGQPRQFIDETAKTLTSPFSSIVQSDSQWVIHGIPALFALLVYGVGIGWLARFSAGLSGRHHLGHSSHSV